MTILYKVVHLAWQYKPKDIEDAINKYVASNANRYNAHLVTIVELSGEKYLVFRLEEVQ